MQVEKFRRNCYAAAMGVLLSASGHSAFAQSDSQAWVSDELSTYVRSGPTDGYRIVGTLNAGEQVDVLETSGNYTRVRSNSGDTVWVLSSELQQTPSARQQLPELQAQDACLDRVEPPVALGEPAQDVVVMHHGLAIGADPQICFDGIAAVDGGAES